MRHALSLAGVVTLLSVVSVRGQQADILPPEVDNKWVFFVPGPISRAPDGLRITVPFSLKNADFKGTIIYLARFHEVNAFDNSGVRCGTNFGNIIVTGLM